MSQRAASLQGVSWVTPTAPSPDLSSDVVTGWTARVAGQHRLVPDGCVDVLWIDNGTAWVCGPETSAWTFSLPTGTVAVGVRFRPGRAGRVLGFVTAEVSNRRLRLDDVLGSRAARSVVEHVGDAATPAERLEALQHHVRRWRSAARPPDPVADAVVRLLHRDIATGVTAMADATGLSERQLHRRCVAAFGYGPATLRRILRLQRFLRLARHPASPSGLAGLADAAGYTDQAHLSHECRTIAGVSPRALVAR